MLKNDKGLTAKEILQKSIQDIDNGKWICNYLQLENFGDSPNPKEMACAVGLVSLNSGDTVTEKILIEKSDWRDAVPSEIDLKNGNCTLNQVPQEFAGEKIEVEVARYTDQKSPQGAKEAINALWNSLPKDEKYIPWNKSGLKGMVTRVVEYNDNSGITSTQAKKWFTKALNSLS